MTKQELSVQVDRIIEAISEGYELLNDTGDYECEPLDKAASMVQDALRHLQYVKNYELGKKIV